MAEKKKSIIEEALLEAKSLEDALKANTKEMLAAHMSKEFESIVESSLKEKDEEEKEEEVSEQKEEMDLEMDDAKVEGSDDEEEDVLDLEDEESDEVEDIELDLDAEVSDEESDDVELDLDTDLDLDAGEGEEGEEMELDLELPSMDMGGEEVMDLTGASDDEVVKVFKRLSDDDEVEVVKDADGIHLTDNETGAEYYIKESMDDMVNEKEYCAEGNCGSMYEEEDPENMDEVMYEIELDEDSDMMEMFKEMDDMKEGHYEEGYHMKEEDVEEGAYIDEEEEKLEEDKLQRHRKFAGKQRYSGAKVGRRDESRKLRKPLVNRKPKPSTVSETKIMKEYVELKAKNEEYKKALNVFKDKLNEVALFNTNLAYVNRIFTEHSTTKKEKMDILKRFDNAESIKESKNIYKTIKTELDNKKPINESVQKKVNKTIESSKSQNLNESTAYVDPQITAIKDLMRRIS